MESNTSKAILVVSFGTSHEDTRRKNIDRIEQEIQEAFPEYRVYRAWTSRIIMRILKNRDGVLIDNVEEAFERMKQDGIREVVVQPTHVMNGIENDSMLAEIEKHRPEFKKVLVGAPLLNSVADNMEAADVVAEEWKTLQEGDALVLMGHGTTHYANNVYAAMDYAFKDRGYSNIFLGTVEAYPSIENLIGQVKKMKPDVVHLAPFMIVAGDHAKNDLSGDNEDSWASQFRACGFKVECHLKGLGEYSGIRKMFVRHVEEA